MCGISYDGGYAEYMVAPEGALAKIPDSLDAIDAAPLLCAGVTTFNALRNAGVKGGATVGVVGMVFNPSNFVAESGTTVKSVLDRAGGLAEEADEKRIYVIRADGSVESLAQRGGQRLSMSTPVLAGDVVLVPRRPLERSFGAQLGDVLALARQAAEVGLLTSQISRASGQADVTTVLPGPVPENRVLDYSETILTPRR